MNNGSRRDFLKRSLRAAGAALAVSPLDAMFASRSAARVTGAAKKILVAGAGLAGMVAAYELKQAGHDVTVVEARKRAGACLLFGSLSRTSSTLKRARAAFTRRTT